MFSFLDRLFTRFLNRNIDFANAKEVSQMHRCLLTNSVISERSKLYGHYQILDSVVGDYTYIAQGAKLSMVTVGKFCSIGPSVLAGYGLHPLNGISTNPMFYSTQKQNGFSLSATNKVQERKPIIIGNDVFIGSNVTILDGITIGHGAVIGAGAVVSKDIPPYAIAIGCPVAIVKYRFDQPTIDKLLEICWWDWSMDELQAVEQDFFNLDQFVKVHLK